MKYFQKFKGKVRWFLLFYLFAFLPFCADATSTLHNLDITVLLDDNGDAYITEVRRMTIDSRGTELYIVIGNLDSDSRVDRLNVRDEMGVNFRDIGKWEEKFDRKWKTYKCGIIEKRNGYELCWGLGSSGERIYTTSYVITNVARAYQDYDGFNFMFVATGLNPSPQSATITISRKDGQPLPQEATKMWAFRFHGDIHWVDGKVVARAEDGLSSEDGMIIMLQLDKGILHPSIKEDDKFETLKEKAFDGSDYGNSDFDLDLETIFYLLLFLVFLPITVTIYVVYVWWNKRKVTKDLLWYRDLPFEGSLFRSNQVINAYQYIGNDYKNLISALVLRLLSIGALRIEEHDVEPSAFKKMMGAKPQRMRLIAIYPLIDNGKTKDMALLKKLHAIFLKASGNDAILQPNELTQWMKGHTSEVDPFMNSLKQNRSISNCNKDWDNTRSVFGMKKFLEDFTLANERHVTELGLWKEYLVFAELFGIAKQVRKDMMHINPEYLNMDQALQQLSNENNTMLLTAYTLSGFRQYNTTKAAEAARSSGSGGHSSWGGGGGFSGGGCGGGIR